MKKILFVCLGNICRSPMAEGIFQSLINKNKLSSKFYCESAGVLAHHVGEMADPRMRAHAIERGYELVTKSRQFKATTDFEEFDLILTMDDRNYNDIKNYDSNNIYLNKIIKMTSYCKIHDVTEVPDPYYGSADGFDLVIDILEDSCNELLLKLN